MDDIFELKKDTINDKSILKELIEEACNKVETIYHDEGFYPKLVVERSWSKHNPVITGEFARPRAYRWYLSREIRKLAEKGAYLKVFKSRPRQSLNDPALLESLDEDEWDFTRKKLFLFKPERIEISLDRLEHYTGTAAEDFQRYILFTNYEMHVDVFKNTFPDCIGPRRKGVQMPAYHYKREQNTGISLVNIGVGPSNAKTITDHVSVLRPDAMIMVGHCGGLRNHQEIGDFVLASGYMRADNVLDDSIPENVPITPNFLLNIQLHRVLEDYGMNYRLGTVYSTDNRNWEFARGKTVEAIHISRSIAIDMESATVATNGFRYRIPHATLLCISDKPLHGKPKLNRAARHFYQDSKDKHLEIVIKALDQVKDRYPDGLPNASIRAINEPLMGGPE